MIVATARIVPPKLVQLGLAHRAERRALARLQRFAHGVLDETALPERLLVALDRVARRAPLRPTRRSCRRSGTRG